tara:strand:+ start:2073 stop:2615 length:543 start_codon:yes stop_codon:yes gene_type:complete
VITKNILGGSVYVLFDGNNVVYVGQSVNPMSRIGAHNRDKTFTHYRVMPCRKKRMSYWESLLILRFKPKYNKAGLKRSPLKQALIDHGPSKKPFIRQYKAKAPSLEVGNTKLGIRVATSTSGGYKFSHPPKASSGLRCEEFPIDIGKEGWVIGYEPQAKPTVVVGESIKILLDKVKDEQQ